MRKLFLVLGLLVLSACTFGKIEPGHVGVVVPLTGDNKGHPPDTIDNGWYFYSINTQVYEFPVYNLQHNWTNVDNEGNKDVDERLYFMDKNGQRVGADVGIQYNVPREKVSLLFIKYRQGLDQVRDTVLKMTVRNALNIAAQSYSAEDMFGEKRSAFFKDTLELVRSDMEPNGLHVDNLYLNGELELPKALKETIQAQIQAKMSTQQKENEKATVIAEMAKQVATAEGEAKSQVAKAEGVAKSQLAVAEGNAKSILVVAEAQARANQLLTQSLTPQVLELKRLEISRDVQLKMADKWGGGVPTTILPGQGNAPFLFDLRNQGK
jgi:regulator of protease activity HflC (stomatin/prohibitin superfamily)